MSNEFVKNFYHRNYRSSKKIWVRQRWIMGYLYHVFEKYSIWRDEIWLDLIKKYKDDKFGEVIDIWVSSWNFLVKLSKEIDWIDKYYWIDVNDEALNDANTTLKEAWLNFELQNINIDDWIRIYKEKFNLVTMFAVLEHVFDPEKVVKELNNIMKKWWLIVIEVPNLAVFFRRFSLLFWNRPRTSWDLWWDGWHLCYFTVRDLKNLLKNNGFDVLNVSWSWVFAKFRNWWPSFLSWDIIIIWRKK